MGGSWAIAAMMLALQESPAVAPGQAGPAMAEAIANKSRVKVNPRWTSRVTSEVPEAARAKGAHGKVVVSAIVGADGRLAEAMVKESSRSPELDAAALTAASAARFEPARDANGKPLAIVLDFAFSYSNIWKTGKMDDVLRYGCRQFILDQDWWAATWPGKRSEIYEMTSGVSASAELFGSADFKASSADFKARWEKALADCRKMPDRLFVDLIEPEGRALRRLAAAGG